MDKIYHKTTWQNSPSTNTPINETNLNNIENGVDAIDSRVVDLGNTKSSVDWVQLQQSGDKIAEITIDGVKKAVYSKQASGSVLENALKSEGFAVGTQDGEPVSKSSPYYENNAKYYAEDSAKSSAESKYWSEKSGSSRLVSMDDVDINSPQDKQALVYDETLQKWINGQSIGGGTAEDTTYDNSKSGLQATNVQDAIDEQKQDLNNYEQTTDEEIDGIKSSLAQLDKELNGSSSRIVFNGTTVIPSGNGLTWTSNVNGIFFASLRLGKTTNVEIARNGVKIAEHYMADMTQAEGFDSCPIITYPIIPIKIGDVIKITKTFGNYAWINDCRALS